MVCCFTIGVAAGHSLIDFAMKREYKRYQASNLSVEVKMLRKAVVALFLCSAFSGLAHAQATGQRSPRNEEYVIRGKIVFDSPYAPDERIEIRLERSGQQLIDTVFSDGVGNFMFRNLLPELYYVRVKVEGYEEARERVELSSSFNRSATLTLFLKSEVLVRKTAEPRFEGDPDIVDVAELRADYPQKAVEEYEKAIEDAEKGNAKKAVDRLEKAVELAPDFYQAQNNLGVQYRQLGRYRDAERIFLIARELNKNAAQPLTNLGSMYLDEGQAQIGAGKNEEASATFEKAVDLLEQAIQLNAFSAPARYFLGSALFKTTEYDRAETMLARALELDDQMHEVRLMLVNVYMKQQRYKEVLDQLGAYIENNQDSPQLEAVKNMKAQIEQALKQ